VDTATISEYLIVLICALQIVWAFRLGRLGLIKRYPALFIYLVAATVLAAFGLVAHKYHLRGAGPSLGLLYAWYWVVSMPLSWTFLFCVVVEAGKRMMVGFSGIQRLGQLAMYGASVGAVLVFLVMLLSEASADTWRRFWLLQDRSAYMALTGLCFMLVSMASFFHLRVPRNVKVVFASFGLVFAVQASRLLLPSLWESFDLKLTRVAMPVVTVISMAIGTFAFSNKGEAPEVVGAARVVDSETAAQATHLLRGFNDAMLKLLRS
jgi:hypothetical protein